MAEPLDYEPPAKTSGFHAASGLIVFAVGGVLTIGGVVVAISGPLSDVGGPCVAAACAIGPLLMLAGFRAWRRPRRLSR